MGFKRELQRQKPTLTKLRALAKAYQLKIDRVDLIPGEFVIRRGQPGQPEHRDVPLPGKVLGQYKLKDWERHLRDIALFNEAVWQQTPPIPCYDDTNDEWTN